MISIYPTDLAVASADSLTFEALIGFQGAKHFTHPPYPMASPQPVVTWGRIVPKQLCLEKMGYCRVPQNSSKIISLSLGPSIFVGLLFSHFCGCREAGHGHLKQPTHPRWEPYGAHVPIGGPWRRVGQEKSVEFWGVTGISVFENPTLQTKTMKSSI
jgi:hypothetical protein